VYTAGDRGGFRLHRQVLPRRRRAVNNRLVSIATPQPMCSTAVYVYYTAVHSPACVRRDLCSHSDAALLLLLFIYTLFVVWASAPAFVRPKCTHNNISFSNGFRCVCVVVVAVENTIYKRSSKRTRLSAVRLLEFPAAPSPPIAIVPSPPAVSCLPTFFFLVRSRFALAVVDRVSTAPCVVYSHLCAVSGGGGNTAEVVVAAAVGVFHLVIPNDIVLL